MTTVEGTPCACRFNGNGERIQECSEHAASRVAELEQQVAALKRPLPPSGGLCMACAGPVDESGATTADEPLRKVEEVAQRDAAYAANATLAQQVAALADALAGMTRSVYRCYEHNDALGDAMDLAKDVLRAAGRKP